MKEQAMAGRSKSVRGGGTDEFGRLLCFLVLSTVGMGSIGLGLLAEPLAGYYADRALIASHERRLAKLDELYQQQGELLGNSENPGVIERVAIDNLNYVRPGASGQVERKLPAAWPDLEMALAKIEQGDDPVEPGRWHRLMARLSSQRASQGLLMLFGGVLVLVALSCFYAQTRLKGQG